MCDPNRILLNLTSGCRKYTEAEKDDRVILVTELRGALDGGVRGGYIVIGTPDRLMLQLIEENYS